MAEKIHEGQSQNHETAKNLESLHDTQSERLKEKRELEAKSVERGNAEQALEKAEKAIEKQEKVASKEKVAKSLEREPKRSRKNSKAAQNANFKKEMQDVRQSMSAPSRAFSKLIHVRAIEKTSEAIGSTIARPNAILAGSLTALLLSGGVYFWALAVGYPLSGFETIGAFIIGWLVGIIFDFTRVMITGKR